MEHNECLAVMTNLNEDFGKDTVRLFKKVISSNVQSVFEPGEIYMGERDNITNWGAIVTETIAIYVHDVKNSVVRYSIIYYELVEKHNNVSTFNPITIHTTSILFSLLFIE